MIPTIILVGLALGLLPRRWQVVGVVVASVAWAVRLVIDGVIAAGDGGNVLGAMIFALVNVIAGLVVMRAVVPVVRNVIDELER